MNDAAGRSGRRALSKGKRRQSRGRLTNKVNDQKKIVSARAARELADRLANIPSVSRFDVTEEPQGSTIAHALSGIADSSSVILNDLLPKLFDETKSTDELDDVLLDIGEELRHILYHIKDTKYYGYLIGDDSQRTPGPTSSPEAGNHA